MRVRKNTRSYVLLVGCVIVVFSLSSWTVADDCGGGSNRCLEGTWYILSGKITREVGSFTPSSGAAPQTFVFRRQDATHYKTSAFFLTDPDGTPHPEWCPSLENVTETAPLKYVVQCSDASSTVSVNLEIRDKWLLIGFSWDGTGGSGPFHFGVWIILRRHAQSGFCCLGFRSTAGARL